MSNWLIEKCEAVRRSTIRRGAVETVSGYAPLALPGSTGERVRMMTVYGKSVQNGTPAPDAPVSVVGVQGKCRSRGRNLCPKFTAQTQNGITLSVDGDGTCHLFGTSTASSTFIISGLNMPGGKTYTVSANNVLANSGVAIAIRDSNYGYIGFSTFSLNNQYTSVSATATKPIGIIYILVYSGTTLTDFVIRPQLTLGSTATPYAPFASPSIIAHPTLHGIPLASTATDYTYIDSNGQKYVADTWTWREEGIWEHVQRDAIFAVLDTQDWLYRADKATIYPDVAIFMYATKIIGNTPNALSNRFLCYSTNLNSNHFRFAPTLCEIGMQKTLLPGWDDSLTVSQKVNIFKSWINLNPTDILFRLDTPIVTQYPHLPWMHTIDASHAGNPLDIAYLDNVDGTTTMPWIQASYYKEVVI